MFYWETYRPPEPAYLKTRIEYVRGSSLDSIVQLLWVHHFKRPIDTIDTLWPQCLSRLRNHFYTCDWAEVFDFVEFLADCGPPERTERFVEVCNFYLERENSAYRFVNGVVTEITSEAEIESVEAAIGGATAFPGVAIHLKAALESMSRRSSPDFRNSIKESICAVEALARHLSGMPNATLGSLLDVLQKDHHLHPALRKAFSSLYGYTSDADGIRHALTEESQLTKADARFMLVCCSAFVNYSIDAVASD
jgi:hypothetical protein